MSETATRPASGSIDLYGVRIGLPVLPPAGLERAAPADLATVAPRPCVRFRPGPVERPTRPDWIPPGAGGGITRRRSGTVAWFGDDGFEVRADRVVYACDDVAGALDRSCGALAALVLTHVGRVALAGLVVDGPGGRVAVVGGSTIDRGTLGRALLGRGGRLVADDLLALDARGRAHAGPPFLQVVEPVAGVHPDAGGRYRIPVEPVEVVPAPVDLFVILGDEPVADDSRPRSLDGPAARAALTAAAYHPAVLADPRSPLHAGIVAHAVAGARIVAIPHRWRPPHELADLIETALR